MATNKTILQRWASNPATFPLADEHKLILGTEYEGAVSPGGISLEQLQNGFRQSSVTIASIANGTNYATAESNVFGVGEHGISWDTDGWVTSRGGWWLIWWRLAYSVPATNGFEYWWDIPINIGQKPILRRKHQLTIEKNAAVVDWSFAEHDNLVDISSEPYRMSVMVKTNIDTNDKIRVCHSGSQWGGAIASWPIASALVSFMRINQEDV